MVSDRYCCINPLWALGGSVAARKPKNRTLNSAQGWWCLWHVFCMQDSFGFRVGFGGHSPLSLSTTNTFPRAPGRQQGVPGMCLRSCSGCCSCNGILVLTADVNIQQEVPSSWVKMPVRGEQESVKADFFKGWEKTPSVPWRWTEKDKGCLWRILDCG